MLQVSIQQRLTALSLLATALLLTIPLLTAYQRSNVDPLMERAALHLERSEWDAAISASTAAIQRDPLRSIAYVYRGIAYDQLGDPDAALRDFDRAWSLNPRSAPMFNAKGWLYYRQGYLTAAIDHYNIAIALDPNMAQVYYNLARALDDYGYPAGALLNYQRFLERYDGEDEFSRYALERIIALGG